MILKDRFDRLPTKVQEFIKAKLAREGKRPLHPSQMVSVDTGKLHNYDETKSLGICLESSAHRTNAIKSYVKAAPVVSSILDSRGQPIIKDA